MCMPKNEPSSAILKFCSLGFFLHSKSHLFGPKASDCWELRCTSRFMNKPGRQRFCAKNSHFHRWSPLRLTD